MQIEYDAPMLKKSDLKKIIRAFENKTANEKTTPEKEKEHQQRMSSISSKLKAGKKLSAADMLYLQTHDIMAYIHALRVQQTRKSVTSALKHAKSKQQAKMIISNALTQVSKDDPDREALIAAISDIADKFMKSPAYQQLPETNEDDKDRENNFEDKSEDNDDEEENDDDIIAGEPTGTYHPDGADNQISEISTDIPSFDMAG